MLPLILLLFIAIFKRIGEYGITELRYYVLLLSFWLAFISIYQIITKYKNLKIIAFSFFIIAVLSSFGPWGAFSISKKSQLSRFERILTENNLLVDGLVVKADSSIERKAEVNISSIVSYIVEYHSEKALQKYFTVDFDTLFADENSRYNKEVIILEQMGLRYISKWEARTDSENGEFINYVTFNAKLDESIINVKDFDYLIEINNYYYNYPNEDADSINETFYGETPFRIREKYNTKTNIVTYEVDNNLNSTFSVDINSIVLGLLRDYPVNDYTRYVEAEKMAFSFKNDLYIYNYQIVNISFDLNESKAFSNLSVSARLLLKVL